MHMLCIKNRFVFFKYFCCNWKPRFISFLLCVYHILDKFLSYFIMRNRNQFMNIFGKCNDSMTRSALIFVGILFAGFISIAFTTVSYVFAQTPDPPPPPTTTTNYWTNGAPGVIPKMESAYTSVDDK